jgi:dTDP-glucose 4,6-dehydratase
MGERMILGLGNRGIGIILLISEMVLGVFCLRFLVTGGLGFIGSNFIRYMMVKYNDVRVINVDNMSYGSNPANLRDLENDERYKFVKGDISNKKLMEKLVRNVDVIVNFAAESHVDRSIANPRSFLKNNTIGLVNILEAVRLRNREAKVIHISTDEVYGDILNGSFKEDDRLKPSSPYAASKAAADLFCLAYHRTYGLDIIITRSTNIFGPYQFPEKFIPKTIIRALLNLKIPVYGTGKNIRNWLYVLDNCEAIDLILKKGKSGEIYNISGKNEYMNIDIVRRILKFLGKNEDLIEFVEDRPGHDIRYSLNTTKIETELKWRPKYDFDHALNETIKWYVNNEWWWKPLATDEILHPTPWKIRW